MRLSRLSQPLAVLIQSSSAAGKTTLMDAALAFMPPEDQIKYSAMTGQSLYYMGETSLKHKILAIAEEEGVAQASYALKLLQSEGKLTLASTEKNSDSGRQQTQSYEVEGPVMMFLTTTSENPDPELQNRCITLRVNETPEQTAAIHQRQRSEYRARWWIRLRSNLHLASKCPATTKAFESNHSLVGSTDVSLRSDADASRPRQILVVDCVVDAIASASTRADDSPRGP